MNGYNKGVRIDAGKLCGASRTFMGRRGSTISLYDMKTHTCRAVLIILTLLPSHFLLASDIADLKSPILEPMEIIEIAKSYVTEQGYDLNKYEIDSINYEYIKHSWYILFDGNELRLGNHFMVIIEDKENPLIKIEGGA